MKKTSPELLFYICAWAIVFCVPVVENVFDISSGFSDQFNWKNILISWLTILPFFVLFLINNIWLAPRLFLRQRVKAYIAVALALSIVVITAFDLLTGPKLRMQRGPHRHVSPNSEMIVKDRPEMPKGPQGPEDFDRPDRPMEPPFEFDGGHKPRQGPAPEGMGFRDPNHRPGNPGKLEKPQKPEKPSGKVFLFGFLKGPYLIELLTALLILGFNIAVKLYYKSQSDKQALQELQTKNLQTNLDYLKYQINPHFFMNTLNNIHALVDIDPELSKQAILELSRLMRYVLYESNQELVQLGKEVQFITHYSELMRLRFLDSVKINLSLPEADSTLLVPPLIYMCFVENAFKHGINYQKSSYVDISVIVENEKIIFNCVNSNFSNKEDQHHGIGLENVKKRLDLIYGNDYKLNIENLEDTYKVNLEIPAKHNI